MNKKIFIIGCGGVGSYLVPVLLKLLKKTEICLVDGDKLETKNLDRQLFKESDIGKLKVTAMAEGLESPKNLITTVPNWYGAHSFQHSRTDILFVLADNHPTRKAALDACDRMKCTTIIAGNETFSAEAYYYRAEWKGTYRDPRIYYTEIETSTEGDPRRAAIGCTGEAQENNVQLASANFMAAALAIQLYTIWNNISKELIDIVPYKLISNQFALETHKPLTT